MAHFIDESVAGGVATIRLNRPAVHNAFDDVLIAEITEAFAAVGRRRDVRAIVLAAEGKSFCAGADLAWMQRMAAYTQAENLADAGALAAMLRTVRDCPKPTIARVQGAVYGGGVGLVAACDLAVATSRVKFCLSEVKLGIIPAVIAPYLLAKMQPAAVRRYALTAEPFDAAEAKTCGLLNDVVEADAELDAWISARVAGLLAAGPEALTACKALLSQLPGMPATDAERLTIEQIAALRVSPEGQEGLRAFLEKRRPGWTGGES